MVTDTSVSFNVAQASFVSKYVVAMQVDGSSVAKASKYVFSTTGTHRIRLTVDADLSNAGGGYFDGSDAKLIDVSDFVCNDPMACVALFAHTGQLMRVVGLDEFVTSLPYQERGLEGMFMYSAITDGYVPYFPNGVCGYFVSVFAQCPNLILVTLADDLVIGDRYPTEKGISFSAMFYGSSALQMIYGLDKVTTTDVVYSFNNFVRDCTWLTSPLIFPFEWPNDWYLSLNNAFTGASHLTEVEFINPVLDVSTTPPTGMSDSGALYYAKGSTSHLLDAFPSTWRKVEV